MTAPQWLAVSEGMPPTYTEVVVAIDGGRRVVQSLLSSLQLEVLLHYFYSVVDYREGDFSNSAVRQAVDWLRSEGLLEQDPGRSAAYRATERARVYIEAVLSVPPPVQKWVMS